VSASISQDVVWDPWLSSANEAPDPYFGLQLEASCSSSSLSRCAAGLDNTFNPVWNAPVTATLLPDVIIAGALLKPWCAFVLDADGFTACSPPYQTIGQCVVTLTEQDLLQGSTTISSCPNPDDGTNHVTSLELTFKHVP